MIIHDVICNGCNEHYIEGEYFKCSICNDYKLCEDCMAKNIRIPPCDLGHEMNLQDHMDDWQNAMKIGKFKQGSQYSPDFYEVSNPGMRKRHFQMTF